ncbi:MAG TPA: mechanosensitive ion channel family protein [bacterium]|nr:mechanosensitive ion channel family protein [bacterium]
MINKLTELARQYSDQMIKWALAHGMRVVLIIVIFAVLFLLLRFALRRFIKFYLQREEEGSEKEKRVHTMTRVLSVLGAIILFVTGAMMVVGEVGIDIKPVIMSVGIGGVALGFGAQSLVKDVISGFFILFEDQLRVGDVVQAAGQGGVVESVGLRVLVLRDLAGNRIIIPNGEIKAVVNMTYEYSRYVFDIGVAYKEDVDRVIEVVKKVGAGLSADPAYKNDIREPLEVLGLDRFDDSAVVIKARITTRPIKQWVVGREFNRRLKKAFDEAGIEIPFPHRTIYYGDAPKPAAN